MSSTHLRSLTSQSSRQLDVLLLDSDPLGVDGTQVGVLKERDQVSLDGLLQSSDSRGLESLSLIHISEPTRH